jgi:hypothetical protein
MEDISKAKLLFFVYNYVILKHHFCVINNNTYSFFGQPWPSHYNIQFTEKSQLRKVNGFFRFVKKRWLVFEVLIHLPFF